MATGLRHKSLEIKVVTAELDIPQLAGVKTAAFRDSPLHAAMYPVKNENAMLEFYGARERVELLNPMQTLVAVVDTSRSSPAIIAYARWTIPLNVAKEQQRTSADPSMAEDLDSLWTKLYKERPAPPDGTNYLLNAAYLDVVTNLYNAHADRERDYTLRSLATHPDEGGRGCASMLLEWGIEQAEKNGARIFLMSMPVAYKLYLKHGWRDVDEMKLDLVEYGGDETFVIKAMIRDPYVGRL